MTNNEMEAENKIFRRLLWIAHAKGLGYGDDGEMQFDRIDFKRMTAQEIEAAITCRGQQKVNAYLASLEGQQFLAQRLAQDIGQKEKD